MLEYMYNRIKNTLRKIDMRIERAKYGYIEKLPKDINYFDGGLYDVVYESSCKWPHNIALQYFNAEISYKELIKKINKVAASLKAIGAEKGDRITVCMPNTPEAIYTFYAINEIGAVANMVHPLSSEKRKGRGNAQAHAPANRAGPWADGGRGGGGSTALRHPPVPLLPV